MKAKHLSGYCVYQFINLDGCVIYVGCTKNLRRRVKYHELWKRHGDEIAYVAWQVFKGGRLASKKEEVLTKKFKPKYNKVCGGYSHRFYDDQYLYY